jgi:transcriptional regulator with XRE-family HTH domain
MDPISTTGDRVRRLQKLRGLNQTDLARLSGLSRRTISDIENDVGNHRNETLHKLALAFQVRTSDLTTPGRPEHEPVPGEPWEDIRDVLHQRRASPEPAEPATPAGVLAALDEIRPDWAASRYSQVRLLLPGLIRDAMALDSDVAGRAARAAALTATASLLTMTRQFEDAAVAARLALDAGPELPDHLAAVSMLTWGLLRQGRTGEAGAMAAEWADRAEPRRFSRATAVELAGYGRMLLYVANAMATDNQPGAAQDALSLARAAAARIGREVPFHAGSTGRFGPATVQVLMAETAVLGWQPDKALVIAERMRGGLSGIEPIQQLRHRLDIASAYSMRKRYPDAVEVMQAIQRDAPQWLPYQQYGRDILEGIIAKRRGPLTTELRDLAVATRLPL